VASGKKLWNICERRLEKEAEGSSHSRFKTLFCL